MFDKNGWYHYCYCHALEERWLSLWSYAYEVLSISVYIHLFYKQIILPENAGNFVILCMCACPRVSFLSSKPLCIPACEQIRHSAFDQSE